MKKTFKDLNVLVLAAGKSTRIQSVVGNLPKPLIQIQGETILERNLRWLASFGIRLLWINLHYQSEMIKERIESGEKFGLAIKYSNEPDLLGTAGAFKLLEKKLQGTTLVIYGDNLLHFDLVRFREVHERAGLNVTIALFDQNIHPHTGISGGRVFLDDEDRITDFVEWEAGDKTISSPLINAGVYLLEPEVLQFIPPRRPYDFARDLFPEWLKRGKQLKGFLIDGYCLGVDTPECLASAVSLIESGKVRLK